MKFTKEKLNLTEGLKREWLLTNGIGGFASSTIIGANTRKYHGLLIAPMTPPARRFLILSKLDESLEIDGKKYDFYTNVGQNFITHGYEYQTSFEKSDLPVFTYEVHGVKITKTICMEYGKNTVGVWYHIKNGDKPSKLILAPIMNFRDFHSMSTGNEFAIRQESKGKKEKIIIDDKIGYPIYMKISEGNYIKHENDIFRHMFYVEEEKRGFYPEENHCVPGRYEVEIVAGEEKDISFVCSMEENIDEIHAKDLVKKEIKRLEKVVKDTGLLQEAEQQNNEYLKFLIESADQFIVYRPSFKLHTIIAGYPWFLDWGRDSLIAFEGLLLKTRRFDIAKEVMLTMVRDIKYGLVPNGYSGFDNRPLYNSVDASLLLFEQIQKYIEYTGDIEFIQKNVYEDLEKIIENYITGIDVDDNNIYLDTDGLIVSGTEYTQNTWMDAKVEGFAVTPRNGKAVEINSLWYNALMIMSNLTSKIGKKTHVKKYKELAQKCKTSFESKFYNPRRKCLYDVLGDSKIRPNQLFSSSLTYPVIDPNSEVANQVLSTVEKKLLTPYGLKTLAKGEPNYVETYEGDSFRRDMSYHQGITWPWLLGLYFNCLKNQEKTAKIKKTKQEISAKIEKFKSEIQKVFTKEILENGCIGSIAEIYDTKKPQLPKGTISQAWSVSEILRILCE